MKTNRIKQLFCILFFLLCLVPLAVFLIAGPAEAGANERLPAKPRLMSGGAPNWDVLSDAADYYAGRFGLRQELITANAAVQAAVLRESAAGDVLLGTDGWLYYAETLPDYTGSSPMTERQLWCAAHNLALMREYAADFDVQLLFVCAPNKNTIYPQHMPARYARSSAPSDLDRLEAELTRQSVDFCDVRQTLAGTAQETYYHTDSHWNGYGSALAHDAILRALGRDASLADEAFTAQPHSGDLYQMLYPASSRTEDALSLARERHFEYEGDIRGADDQLIHTFCPAEGALLMFRDSFGNALYADLAEDFGEALFSRAMPYDFSLLLRVLPDVIIVELAERNLSWLCTRPPLLPAPERMPESVQTPELSGAAAQVTRQDSDWEGLVRYDGTFSGVCPDDDSPVLALLNGVCYEACPTDTGFRLIAPDAAQLTVQFRVDGTLYSVPCTFS